MTKPVTPYLQKTYSCTLRFLGSIINNVPLTGLTREELTLLAYLHGNEAVADIAYTGMKPVLTFNPDEGAPEYVASQMDEYRRLARKYDTIVNSGRGKAAVEKCFSIQLIDFDSIVDEVDAANSIDRATLEAERKAAEAEVKSEVSRAGEQREAERKATAEAEAARGGGIGSRLASTIAGSGS